MVPLLNLVEEENKRLGSIDVSIKDGKNRVVLIDRYPKEKYSVAYWRGSPLKTKDYYVGNLAAFYVELMMGEYKPSNEKIFKMGELSIQWKKKNSKEHQLENLPLDYLADWEMKLGKHKHYGDFVRLRVNSPYADIVMECLTGREWNPMQGTLGVLSHQPLGIPFARFVSKTSRYQVKPEDIMPLLDHGFTF